MASINPHFRPDDYRAELRRCVKELGFVGVKLTPNGHAVDLLSRDAREVFDAARELSIPVMVHTGMGVPFADPVRLTPLARDYSDVRIVIAHAGSDFFSVQAMPVSYTHLDVYKRQCVRTASASPSTAKRRRR